MTAKRNTEIAPKTSAEVFTFPTTYDPTTDDRPRPKRRHRRTEARRGIAHLAMVRGAREREARKEAQEATQEAKREAYRASLDVTDLKKSVPLLVALSIFEVLTAEQRLAVRDTIARLYERLPEDATVKTANLLLTPNY